MYITQYYLVFLTLLGHWNSTLFINGNKTSVRRSFSLKTFLFFPFGSNLYWFCVSCFNKKIKGKKKIFFALSSHRYSFLILRLGAPTGILRGGSPVFKRFGPLNLLTFSGGGPHPVNSRLSLSVCYPSEPNVYRRLWEALFGLLMPVTAAWTGATSESSQWLLHVAYYLLWPAIFDYARLSLAFLCRSHPPQLPTAVMKALSGFFTPCT